MPTMEKLSTDWQEVCIDISWGKLRGKKYGSGAAKVLALHGWQDNANSFDRIIPYLDANLTFLAMDLPGHGLSDHLPAGFIYDPTGYVIVVKKLIEKLKWDSFIFLVHSMSGLIGIMYSTFFPTEVQAFINIEMVTPFYFNPKTCVEDFRNYHKIYLRSDKNRNDPLKYNIHALAHKMIKNAESMDESSAKLLLERGSKIVPGTQNQVYLLRDLRLSAKFNKIIPKSWCIAFSRTICCPILVIKATRGYYKSWSSYEDELDAYKEGCPLFSYVEIEGDHHVHMTNAHETGAVIGAFIRDVLLINKSKL